MAQYFLGVDGGQSGTTAVIGDEHGKILGWATAGPCNHVAASEEQAKFVRVMKECVGQAAHRAEMETNTFAAACLGMSGGPDDKAGLLKQVFTADHTFVTHDAMIALAGATAGEPGVVVISGTGSISFGENSRRETARAGGWGYIFGDEGGAFDLVRQSLRAILREHEGWGPRSALTPALLEATGSQDANQLLHLFYKPDWPRARIATLAKSVNRIAEEGDPVALHLVQQAAHHLALLIGAVRSQLFADGEEAVVSWTGGVFSSEILLRRFRKLVSMNDGVRCEAPKHGPATGALLLAYRAMGLPVLPDRHD